MPARATALLGKGAAPERFFQLLILAASTWAGVYGRFTLGPLQEAIRIDLGLTDNQIAWLQGPAVAIAMALGAIPVGVLADRYSRVRLLLIFLALNLLAALVAAVNSGLALLFVSRVLAGLAFAGTLVVAYSIVADLYAPVRRGRATMVIAIGEIAGAPAAFALGGALLSLASARHEDWRWALLWMCLPLLATLGLMATLREPPRTGVVARKPPMREVLPSLWRYRGVLLPLLLARVMVWVADGAVLVWGAPVFARRFALPPQEIGTIMATALLIAGILGPLLGGPLADSCQRSAGPRLTMMALSMLALISVPPALFAVLPDVIGATIALTTFLTLGFMISVVAMALATIVIPGELRGTYIAVTMTVAAISGIGVAPLVVSGLSEMLGGPALIGQALTFVCVTTGIVGAVIFAMARQQLPRAV